MTISKKKKGLHTDSFFTQLSAVDVLHTSVTHPKFWEIL